MSQLSLTTWQRYMCYVSISTPAQGETYVQVSKALRLLDILEFTDDETAEIHLADNGAGQITWQPRAEPWTIEIPEKLLAYLKERIKARNVWQGLPVREVGGLMAALGIEIAEE